MNGHIETTVQTDQTIRFENLGQTVTETFVLSVSSLSNICGQTSTGKVKWVDKAQGGCTSGTTGGQVASEVSPELLLLVDAIQKDCLKLVLEGKVQSLGWKVSDDIGEVAPPERDETLFLGDSHKSVDDA